MDKKNLAALVREISRFLDEVGADEAILFGSRALGEELETSDVDLVVIADRFAGQPFPKRLVELHRHWRLPQFLEALAYTHEELAGMAETRGVVAAALKSGIRIYPRSHAA